MALLACLAGLLGTARAAADAEASEKCLGCHEDQANSMRRSVHSVAADARTPTCVSCHGPADKHAEDPSETKPPNLFRGEKALGAEETSAVCLTCHVKNKQMLLWAGSTPTVRGVVHRLPQAARREGPRVRQDVAADRLLRLPQGAAGDGRPAVAPSDPRRQDDLLRLPRRARLGGPEARPARQHQRDLLPVPRGEARPLRAQPRASGRKLRQLPQPARQQHPGDAQCARPGALQPVPHAHVAGGVGAVGGQPGVFPPATGSQTVPAVTPLSGGKNVVNIWQGRSCLNCHTAIHGSNNPAATNPTPQYLFR